MHINTDIKHDLSLYPQYGHHFSFILCHKPFEDRFGDVANKIYITDNEEYSKQSGAILIDNKGLDSRVFGEIPFWGWIAQQLRDQDSASLCAYRRKIYARPGIQVAQPMQLQMTLLDQMAFCHSPILSAACCEVLPQEEIKILSGNLFFPYNIFSAPKKLIQEWVNFVIPRVTQIMDKVGCGGTYESCLEFVKNNESFTKPVDGKNTDPNYQARIGAFLSERMSSIFWQLLQVPRNYQQVILLEEGQKI